VSVEDLDKELDAYMFQDKDVAKKKLDGDLDEYFSAKSKPAATEEAAEAEAAPAEQSGEAMQE
jgi:hypothetical protein